MRTVKADRPVFEDWLSALLWHWQGENGVSPEIVAKAICEKLPPGFLQTPEYPLPDPEAFLSALETR